MSDNSPTGTNSVVLKINAAMASVTTRSHATLRETSRKLPDGNGAGGDYVNYLRLGGGADVFAVYVADQINSLRRSIWLVSNINGKDISATTQA
jgi:hypothetical protein